MKKLFYILLSLYFLASYAEADFLGIYDNGTDSADDSVWVYIVMWDSLALKLEEPDTLFIYRYAPGGDTLTADTITSMAELNYSGGYYMKRYRAGEAIGHYTVHALGSGNGNYYSLADHNYLVIDQPLGELSSGAIPDSLLEAVTHIDSIRAWVGSPFHSTIIPSLHMKLGLGLSGAAGDGNLKDQLDTVRIYLGKDGNTLPDYTSLHDKLGAYAGAAGVGNNVKDDLAALASLGGGTQPETLIVFSAEDSSRIQGARVCVRTVDQATLKISGLTTSHDGKLILALDPDSFWVELTAYGFNQAFDTLVVTDGGGTDSVFMARFDPGAPPEPGLCRVFGWVYDIAGDSLADIEITVEIPREYHPVKCGNVIITPFSKHTITDSTGYWQLDIIPSSALSREDIEYMFTVKNSEGVIYRAKTIVPQYPSWQLQ